MFRTVRNLMCTPLLVAACSGGTSPAAPRATGTDATGTSAQLTDADVSARALASGGWTYYKRSLDTLVRAGGSGHVESRLRTRFNVAAATQLDANGKVRVGAVFPESSLVVKELYSGSTLSRFAVMMKVSGSPNASTGGWLWAYYGTDGATQISISGKGGGCAGCHASGIDFTRMNDSHP